MVREQGFGFIGFDLAGVAAEVADAEEAISREHTMWRASRTRATS